MRWFLLFLFFVCSVCVHGDIKNGSVDSDVAHTLGEVYRLSTWLNRFFEDTQIGGGCMNVLCLNYLITNLNKTNPYLTKYKIPLYSGIDQSQYKHVMHYADMTDGLPTLRDTFKLLHRQRLLPPADDVTGLLTKLLDCRVNASSYKCYVGMSQLSDLQDLCVEHMGQNCTDATAEDMEENQSSGSADGESVLWKFLWSSDPSGISQLLSKLNSKELSYKTDRIYRVLHENKYYRSLGTAELSPVLSANFKIFIENLLTVFPMVLPEIHQTDGDLNKAAAEKSKGYKKQILDLMKIVYKVASWYLEESRSANPIQLSRSIFHLQLQLNILSNYLTHFINSPGSSSQSFVINKFFSSTEIPLTGEGLQDDHRGIKIINFQIDHLQEQLPSELKVALWEFISMVWAATFNKANNVDIQDILRDMVTNSREFLIIVYKSLKSLNELDNVLKSEHDCSLLKTGATLKTFLNSPINSTGALNICKQSSTLSSAIMNESGTDHTIFSEAATKATDVIIKHIPRDDAIIYEKNENLEHEQVKPPLTEDFSSESIENQTPSKIDTEKLNIKLDNEYKMTLVTKKPWRKKLMTQGDGVDETSSIAPETSSLNSDTPTEPFQVISSTSPHTTLESFQEDVEAGTNGTEDENKENTVIDVISVDNSTEPGLGAPASQDEQDTFGGSVTLIFGCTAALAAVVFITACMYRRHKRAASRRGYMSSALHNSQSGESVYRPNLPGL